MSTKQHLERFKQRGTAHRLVVEALFNKRRTKMTEIKNCPFCGSEAEGPPEDTLGPGATYWLECMNVTCSALIEGDTRAEVIKAWNTCAADEPTTSSSVVYESTTPHARLILEEE